MLLLTDLPDDLFILIITLLSPKDVIRNRRVSRDFNAAFTNQDLNHQLLLQHYPGARELRKKSQNSTPSDFNWADTFQKVVTRYHYLTLGTPRTVKHLALAKSFILPEWCKNHPIAPWQRHLRFQGKNAPFHFPDTLWTYAEGLLIFPSTELKHYALYDLELGTISKIDIGSNTKVVRRLSLKEKVLVVEWSEQQSYHQLNENETVHRHFAAAYDITWNGSSKTWNVVCRNEWKIHFLGLPLNSRDRFFSTHNSTHYAMYLWQPSRSAWGEDEPIEALVVWDISFASPYRPSNDPTGSHKPDDTIGGPKVIMRLSFLDLAFYGIRQGETPVLSRLHLDESHVYIVAENHRWMAGDQASYMLPRLHEVKTIGIPFNGGPRREDACELEGDGTLSYCRKVSGLRELQLAPCWRHEEFPYLTTAESVDAEAGVVFSARQCFALETISINIKSRTGRLEQELLLKDEYWHLLLAKGKICGDERWLIGENDENEVVILFFDRDRARNVDNSKKSRILG